MFLHVAKTQKMGHDVKRSQGRYLDPGTGMTVTWALSKNQICFTLSPEKPHVFLAASEQSLETHLLFLGSQRWLTWDEQMRAVLRFRSSFIPSPSTYPTQHRQTHMVSNPQFLLQSVVSHLTSTPRLNSKPQQQHWEFRRLLHNCGVSATQHSHQFLKVGPSAIQKGKRKSGFLPRANIRSRR